MRDELLGYYEKELAFLRQMGAEFAEKYPKVAGRLVLEKDKCEDPHVERLIEAFSFLAGRIRLKLDDEFPEVTESLLNILYPHYLNPIPSMSIAKFALDPEQGKLTTSYQINKGITLYSKPIHGTPCRFRTCYPTTLWPIEVTSAELSSNAPADSYGRYSQAFIKLSLHCLNNTQLSELKQSEGKEPIDRLRFFLNGEAQLVYPLYELIFNNVTKIELRSIKGKRILGSTPNVVSLPKDNIQAVGFGEDEGLLPYTTRSFIGYRLLTEYFAFPEKYLFFDLLGIDLAAKAGFGEEFEIFIYLKDVKPPTARIESSTFQLGCTPIINLFHKTAEPIQLTHQQYEYHVIADIHRQMATEIYSVDDVITTDPYLQQAQHYQPFYSLRHSYKQEQIKTFWYTTRRASQRKDDPGTEIYISLVDLNFNPNVPAVETLTVSVTCTNRDLPAKLPFGGQEGDFQIEGNAPISQIVCLKKPTNTLRPPMRRSSHWRLISHLSLNYLSIVESKENSAEALREILLLYDFVDSPATRKQIYGIEKVSSRRVVRQIGPRIGTGFVRGTECSIEFDEDQFVGSGVFLFACVLERFLALYTSLNSFSQLKISTKQREGWVKTWLPRLGDQILL
ncbi:MAG: type VI secretion system baseplate subunit TssF [Blastocatellia bacterium]|nr:type VI secretion system baseplate subunit TssF [Blastocatellia bacterium]